MLLAEALLLLGTERSVVVHGSDDLDEVTLTGSTEVAEAARQFSAPVSLDAKRLWFECHSVKEHPSELSEGQCRDDSRRCSRGLVLRGDIVVANAAAALWTGRKSRLARRLCRDCYGSNRTAAPRKNCWRGW